MGKVKSIMLNVWFILISSIGGYLFTLAGMSIGWMVGTLLFAGILSFWRPAFLKLGSGQKGAKNYWLLIGQFILGIELGQKINVSVLSTFKENWLTIAIMLLLSIIFSLLSGVVLWKLGKTDMLTSFFGTTPGGLSAMSGIAAEAGANTAVVSIIQLIRVFLVVGTIPMMVSFLSPGHSAQTAAMTEPASAVHQGMATQLTLTFILVLAALAGRYAAKLLRFPAPWLLGSMLGVAVIKPLTEALAGAPVFPWWPHWFIILSQIFIGACIGSRLNKGMFKGLARVFIVGLLGSICFIITMLGYAYLVSKVTGMNLITSILAFSPGGIAEMATTSVVLHADSTFVVAVQVLRVMTICLILPPLFGFLTHRIDKKKHATSYHVS
ncbi:hypothetical protein EV207_11850 [Scopulibacillus darangshiensis]|uniref:AbrB family transcriptional regulator n=1 Tax=Scopulibacillus darangshiensis TaxID=442528 RepID=A0A4R2NYB0_9BACL|nr:AbrB family transcriptional regulator [Scopulibacillus darangshiensis]TCP27072.1 hypothetical protein EV207_11850 [Scopulibacillus darangshiensis]